MRVLPQANVKAIPPDETAPKFFGTFRIRLNAMLERLNRSLPGATFYDFGNSGAAITLKELRIADLCRVRLTAATPAITMGVEKDFVRTGDEALIEVVQDATGGRVPTWVNATGDNDVVPAPAAGANKKTLYGATYNGAKWVMRRLVTNYS